MSASAQHQSGGLARAAPESSATASVTLYWLPLGAGGRSVRWNGRAFEWLVARSHGRPALDLYHSALDVGVGDERFTIEMAPAWIAGSTERGVVCEGPVGARVLGRSVWFRYEVRRWRNGVIPDLDEAVDGPRSLLTDNARAERLLGLVPSVPRLTWGRDEAGAGEMWNSNSLTSWLLARSGHSLTDVQPPIGGRAPGWQAGLAVAGRA